MILIFVSFVLMFFNCDGAVLSPMSQRRIRRYLVGRMIECAAFLLFSFSGDSCLLIVISRLRAYYSGISFWPKFHSFGGEFIFFTWAGMFRRVIEPAQAMDL